MIPLTLTSLQIQSAVKIVNDAFSKYRINQSLSTNDVNANCMARFLTISDNDKNPLLCYLRSLTPSRKNSSQPFYHFKSVKRAKQILQTSIIQTSSLNSSKDKDFAEFQEFFMRIGAINPFTTANPIEPNYHYDQNGRRKVDLWKEEIFMLCFTNTMFETRYWKEYGGYWDQVCLEFEWSFDMEHTEQWKLNFRNVYYDSGYSFDFINHMNYHLRNSLQIEYLPTGYTRLALHYKRKLYCWENETRLTLNYTNPTSLDNTSLQSIFPIQWDGKRSYVEIPSNNALASWKINKIICGPLVSSSDYQNLETIGKQHNPSIKISRY